MKLVLVRRWLSEKTTIGELFVNPTDEGSRGFECYTLEDKYRGDDPAAKVFGRTAVPCGEYRVLVDYSPKFKVEMPRLVAVPGFTGVRIHPGNDETDTEGCILVGQQRGEDRLEFSRPAYAQLNQRLRYALGKGEELHLAIQMK